MLTPWFGNVPAFYDEGFTNSYGVVEPGDMLTEISRTNGKIKVIRKDSHGNPATLFVPEKVNDYGLALNTKTDMTILLKNYPLPQGDIEARVAIYPLKVWSGALLTDTAHVSDIRAGELIHVIENVAGHLKIRYRDSLSNLPVFGYIALEGANPVKISDGVYYNTMISFDPELTPVPTPEPPPDSTPEPTPNPIPVTDDVTWAIAVLKALSAFIKLLIMK